MASVQELLLAAKGNKSPFQSLLEGAATGFQSAQQGGLDRTIKLIQLDQMRQEMAQQEEMHRQVTADIAAQKEQETQRGFKNVGNGPKAVFPTQKLTQKISQDEKGRYSRTFEVKDPKEVTFQAKEYVDANGKTRIGSYNTGTGRLEQSPEDPFAPLPAAASPNQKLPPNTVLTLNEGKAVARMLPEVETALLENESAFGPVGGRAGTANPYNERAQTIDARMRTASQAFGRFMEGGVLRKEDEEKYRKMFPQLSDTPEVAKNKLAIVRRMLAQKYEDDRTTLGNSGYDVSGFEALAIPPSVFEKTEKETVENGGDEIGWTSEEEEELRRLEAKLQKKK